VLGGMLSGWLSEHYKTAEGKVDFSQLWLVVSGIGLGAALVFAAFFRDRTAAPTVAETWSSS
jgi:hypothetical protein